MTPTRAQRAVVATSSPRSAAWIRTHGATLDTRTPRTTRTSRAASAAPSPRTTASRVARALVVVAVGLLVLAGCVRIDGDLAVNGTASPTPDTVSGTVLIAVSNEWAIAQGNDPADISAAITEELAASPDSGITGEPYDDGEYTGATLTFDDVPLARLSQATEGAFAITRVDDRYEVTGDLSVLSSDDPDAQEPWTARLVLTLPSEVTQHNGTLDGRTVTWELDDTSPDVTLQAVASVGPLPWYTHVPPWLWVLTGLAGVGALLAWWFSRRERREQASDAVGGIRARQARARGSSTSSLDDMLGPRRQTQIRGGRTGPKPRRGLRR